jgi:hypothetical protein
MKIFFFNLLFCVNSSDLEFNNKTHLFISSYKDTLTEPILDEEEERVLIKNNPVLYNFNERIDFNINDILKNFINSIDNNYIYNIPEINIKNIKHMEIEIKKFIEYYILIIDEQHTKLKNYFNTLLKETNIVFKYDVFNKLEAEEHLIDIIDDFFEEFTHEVSNKKELLLINYQILFNNINRNLNKYYTQQKQIHVINQKLEMLKKFQLNQQKKEEIQLEFLENLINEDMDINNRFRDCENRIKEKIGL